MRRWSTGLAAVVLLVACGDEGETDLFGSGGAGGAAGAGGVASGGSLNGGSTAGGQASGGSSAGGNSSGGVAGLGGDANGGAGNSSSGGQVPVMPNMKAAMARRVRFTPMIGSMPCIGKGDQVSFTLMPLDTSLRAPSFNSSGSS